MSIKDTENHIEAKESDYLYIRPSQIPNSGQGLYTAIAIYKEEIIARYTGKILSPEQIKLRIAKDKDQYFIEMPDGSILDSIQSKCFAKYANDAAGYSTSLFKNNSKIALDDSDHVCLIAKRNIKENEEIFCSYGKRYWKNFRATN